MCGIVVMVEAGEAGEFDRALTRLEHRGPDETGVHVAVGNRVTLGHCRLAIVDPGGGHQPLVGPTGVSAVVNGEIYNHAELRAGLGGSLGSASDSEVIVPLFRNHGHGCAEQLDGMFAFVVTDGDRVVAARDPLGIKPLYRAQRAGATAYASELKALADGRWDSVHPVPAGHVWCDDELHRYADLPPAVTGGSTSEAAIEHWCRQLRETLEHAVTKRLMSDVPLGAFLSGGLDSSIIAALAARQIPGLATFALGFEGSADLEAARLVAAHLGTCHHEIIVTEQEVADVLPKVIYHLESYDHDLVPSALPTFLVSRFAAKELKVVLTGEGADELFAGYRYHRDYRDRLEVLQRELRRSVSAMQATNLQRVDRMSMAHSLEARVPFLDTEVVELALHIPPELKLRPARSGPPVEKWILRRAFTGLLPEEIVWREKSQFDEGSGASERLRALAETALGQCDWPAVSDGRPALRPRSVEEAWYLDHLRSSFADWKTIGANVSLWSEGRIQPDGRLGDERHRPRV